MISSTKPQYRHRYTNRSKTSSHESYVIKCYKIFVGGFTPSTTEDLLRTHFSQFGKILSIKLVGKNKRKPKGYGFIVFRAKSAYQAALKFKVHIIAGMEVDCNTATYPHSSGTKEATNPHSSEVWKLYVPNIPTHVTKKDLRATFSKYGTITRILLIFRHKQDCAFGYIEYETETAMKAALAQNPHQVLGDVILPCEVAISKEKIKAE